MLLSLDGRGLRWGDSPVLRNQPLSWVSSLSILQCLWNSEDNTWFAAGLVLPSEKDGVPGIQKLSKVTMVGIVAQQPE